MNKTMTLMKTMVKLHYGWSTKTTKEKSRVALVIVGLLPLFFMYIWLLNQVVSVMYQLLSPSGNAYLILAIAFIVVTIFIFFTSINSVLSSFYFSEDVESFLPLPFHPYQLILAKSIAPLVSLYGISIIFLVPMLMIYGMVSKLGILYYLYSFFIFAFFPIVPYTVVAMIIMYLMRYANISKNKDRTKVIAGLLSILFAVGINVVIRLNQDPEKISQGFASFVDSNQDLLSGISWFVPNAYLGSLALKGDGWTGCLYFLLFLGLSFLFVFLFIRISQRLYFKGVLGLSEGTKRNQSKRHKRIIQVKQRKMFWSYASKEIKILLRTPTFFLQCIVQSVFGPFFLFVILLMENDSHSLAGITDMMSGKSIVLVAFLFTLFIFGTNATAISSISREGRNWHANLYLPIRPEMIIRSKIWVAWSVNLLSFFLLLVAGIWLMNLPFSLIVPWVVITLLANWFTSTLGTLLDLKSPKLNWTNEQEIFKSRLVVLQALLLEVGIFGLITIPIWYIPLTSIWMTSLLLIVLVTVAIYLADRLIRKEIEKRFNHLI